MATSLTITRRYTEAEVRKAIHELCRPFGEHREVMLSEQEAWYRPLGRPAPNETLVIDGLKAALNRRVLSWDLQRFSTATDAWHAGAALTITYAARRGWITCLPDLLTAGIRDAYEHGLTLDVPVAPTTLGWAMDSVP